MVQYRFVDLDKFLSPKPESFETVVMGFSFKDCVERYLRDLGLNIKIEEVKDYDHDKI